MHCYRVEDRGQRGGLKASTLLGVALVLIAAAQPRAQDIHGAHVSARSCSTPLYIDLDGAAGTSAGKCVLSAAQVTIERL